MPKLKGERKTTKITLPAPEGAECEVYVDLIFGDAVEIMDLESDTLRGLKAVEFLVKSWNLEGEDGKVLPVTAENIKLLPVASAQILAEYSQGLIEGESVDKKKD